MLYTENSIAMSEKLFQDAICRELGSPRKFTYLCFRQNAHSIRADSDDVTYGIGSRICTCNQASAAVQCRYEDDLVASFELVVAFALEFPIAVIDQH